MTTTPTRGTKPHISIAGDTVEIAHVSVESAELARLLTATAEDGRVRLVQDVLSLGARGMTSMTLAATIDHADARFQHSLEQAVDRLQRHVVRILDDTSRAVDESLDPDRRTSVMGRAVAQLTEARAELVGQFDLARSDSRSSQLVEAINQMIGPSGEMQRLLEAALDVSAEGSALAEINSRVDRGFAELRDLMVRRQGALDEAERGTAKGLDFEDVVEEALRSIARRLGGCTVEATGRAVGSLSAASKVGDFVIENDRGHRIVLEAKNKASLALTGKTGMLAELDRAAENRRADFAMCVSAVEAFPSEVGAFAVYGNRLLVVDDGEGTLLEAGVRWAFAHLALKASHRPSVDIDAIRERFERIRQHSARLTSIKRSLSTLKESIDRVQGDIGGLQNDLRSEIVGIEHALLDDDGTDSSGLLRLVADD